MVQEGDNPRGRVSRQILSANNSWTFEQWIQAAFDTRVISAEELLPELLAELQADTSNSMTATNTVRVERLNAVRKELAAWDRRATTDSVAMTVFSAWRESISARNRPTLVTAEWRIARLSDVLDSLEQKFGTWRVAWGEINRLQRIDESKNEPFSDARPSFSIPGVSDGAVFTFYARGVSGQKRRYGRAGASYVSVVEFGPQVRSLSLHVFGASGSPGSKHYTDQAGMYARGEFKPAWLTLKDIRANLEAEYQPGAEAKPSR
jgi:acyl-homoserine lactone acylase PvdQ